MSVNIYGQILDWRNKLGIEALEIEVWEKDQARKRPFCKGKTDENGRFSFYLEELQSDIFFKIFEKGKQIHAIEESIRKSVQPGRIEVRIIVESPGEKFLRSEKPWLAITSLDDLFEHENEIIERIAATPNGGNLFLIHPFMLLEDIGVRLSEKARQEIICIEPNLSSLSLTPYRALKLSNSRQRIEVHVNGLFRRKGI